MAYAEWNAEFKDDPEEHARIIDFVASLGRADIPDETPKQLKACTSAVMDKFKSLVCSSI